MDFFEQHGNMINLVLFIVIILILIKILFNMEVNKRTKEILNRQRGSENHPYSYRDPH